jgi:hypothetical protein
MLVKKSEKKNKKQFFWDWFSKNSDTYFNFENDQQALFERLHFELGKIHPGLAFEFSPVFENGTREFVISGDGIKSAFPFVTRLVESAPNLEKWKIIAFRQPRAGFNEIELLGIKISVDDVYFRFAKDNGKLNIELNIKGYSDSPEWTGITFILLDTILGEYHTEMSLGFIDRKMLNENEIDELFPIRELPKIIEEYHLELCN